jgi:hypothetical protein
VSFGLLFWGEDPRGRAAVKLLASLLLKKRGCGLSLLRHGGRRRASVRAALGAGRHARILQSRAPWPAEFCLEFRALRTNLV